MEFLILMIIMWALSRIEGGKCTDKGQLDIQQKFSVTKEEAKLIFFKIMASIALIPIAMGLFTAVLIFSAKAMLLVAVYMPGGFL